MKKNAFTLIELIATIGLLGMLATITITISVRKINETKERARDTMIESIELAAKQYVTDRGSEILEFNNNDNAYISLQTLVEKEYFTESLIDPTTKKSLPLTNEIYVTREESGEITSTYNVNQRNEPKLTLNGPYNEYIEEGSEYVEKGVTAISSIGEDVSSNVKIAGTVDTTIANTYKITYELDNVIITRNVIVFSKNLSTQEYYKFTINLNGGTSNKKYQTKYKAGSIITLEEPTKEGYKFIGWNIQGKGSNISGNILTTGPGIINVYAIWKEEIRPINFETDDWATIVAAVQRGNHPYQVGNTKKIDLGSLGEHTIRVANITKCSDLQTEPLSKTACGFVLEFADIIASKKINENQEPNVGGWTTTTMKSYLNETVYNALHNDLKKGIIDTYVVSSKGGDSDAGSLTNGNYGSTNKLYLLSPQEVYGSSFTDYYDSSKSTSRQLDYYATYKGTNYTGVSTTNYEGAKKNNSSGTASTWWLRSAHSRDSYYFYRVNDTGYWDTYLFYISNGISPAFRLSQ